MIRLIRSYEYSAEKEYIKEFFRLIGCLFTDVVVDWNDEVEWAKKLEPVSNDNVVDIVLNCYDYDPYEETCKSWGINRLYCYVDPAEKTFRVSSTALEKIERDQPSCEIKEEFWQSILAELIEIIWQSYSESKTQIQNILKRYSKNTHGDLFYILQAKRCLRVLDMSEVLDEPDARVPYLSVEENPYVEKMLAAMWEFRTELDESADCYSIHAQTAIDCMIREITGRLPENELNWLINTLGHNGVAFDIVPVPVSVEKMWYCINRQPEHLQNYLMLSSLYRSDGDYKMEERCLKYVIDHAPEGLQGYAFVHYRLARFYEKVFGNKVRAEEHYRISLEWNPENYQAMFKLALFAAADGRMEESELYLNTLVKIIFRGKPFKDGDNPSWDRLTMKESQYVFKAYILLAKIAINSDRRYSAKVYSSNACIAADSFCDAAIIKCISSSTHDEIAEFFQNQCTGKPSWAMWKVLQSWGEYIIRDDLVCKTVNEHLAQIGNHIERECQK